MLPVLCFKKLDVVNKYGTLLVNQASGSVKYKKDFSSARYPVEIGNCTPDPAHFGHNIIFERKISALKQIPCQKINN